MVVPLPLPELTLQRRVYLGFRFGVFFFTGGVTPNRLDIRFQKVTGLTATVSTDEIKEGGQNLYAQKVPTGIKYENLVLERGMVVGSPVNLEFNAAMSSFSFTPSNVLVTLFDILGETGIPVPVSAWMFLKAYPVRWATSGLDAASKTVLVDTLELAYTRMQVMRI